MQNAAISPDGRFLLSVQSDNGNESLWLRNIPTGSDTQVLPASGQSFASLVFSPDGNSFYFRETAGGAAAFNLFRAPLLGGSPTLLAKDVDGGPIFSPDGKRIVYSRYNDPELNKWRLLEARRRRRKRESAVCRTCARRSGRRALLVPGWQTRRDFNIDFEQQISQPDSIL